MKIVVASKNITKQDKDKHFLSQRTFCAYQRLSIKQEDIHRIGDNLWEIHYYDLENKYTYLLNLVQEIDRVEVERDEFEELRKIDNIKELITLHKIVMPTSSSTFVLLIDLPDFEDMIYI
ncbi:MAG: hypothetical protein HWQ43_08080 [Nostoc sp. JL31]|uniref:hypothetical protein n=1 Tax=Nostoc sp. JL31 TaxID=2815395 RepID=UPI0025F2CCA9|nr:hypothetical protein [Nostoc sp. JL31]MBN3889124.1 hypothetical protein [Nostoc sp. JL31]